MHEQFPNSGKTSAPQVAAERLDRTGGAHSDPIDSDRDNDHVRELATSSDAALVAPVAPGPTPRLAAVIVLIVAIVVTAALLGLSYEPAESVATTRAPAALSGHPSIAVLPFLNRGNDPRQKDFAQGISEDLATDLSKLSRLHVISSDSLANERRWMSMQHVAHELGVRYLLHGCVRRAGNRVRINAKRHRRQRRPTHLGESIRRNAGRCLRVSGRGHEENRGRPCRNT